MPIQRCRCGACGRFIQHMANDDSSCARCCNYPVYKDGDNWHPIICDDCKEIIKDDYDSEVPW